MLLRTLVLIGKEVSVRVSYRLREKYFIDFSILVDLLRIRFLSFVSFITFSVINYRKEYMGEDRISKRFIILVTLFVLSIFILISSPRFLIIILGWDGLGVTSFLLVIYYNNVSSLISGLVTIYLNRLGDFFMILSFWVLFECIIFQGGNFFSNVYWEYLFLVILLARITKRAQLPFSSWLPAAIAAPTPVSSLVHSSTLVTAGVYVILRFFYLTEESTISSFLCWVSLLTCFGAGLIACYENDLKKLVAISTLRQLGLMIFAYSVGEDLYSFFHIVCHALFKALLFLSCGFCIINLYGLQESRLISKWGVIIAGNSFTLGVSILSLIGFPFLTGFFSKDIIIEAFLGSSPLFFLYAILFSSCILTGIYGLRGLLLVTKSQRISPNHHRGKEYPLTFFGMLILGIWSVSLGKSLGLTLALADSPLISLTIKIRGILIVAIGLVFSISYIWVYIMSPLPKSFFGDIVFLNWFFGGFSRKSLEAILFSIIGEFGWLNYLGAGGLFSLLSFTSNKNPFYLGGAKVSFTILAILGFSTLL